MSESNASIPIMRKPVDEMSTGLNSSNLAASAMQRHPIDRMQRGELNRNYMLWIGGLVLTGARIQGILSLVLFAILFQFHGLCMCTGFIMPSLIINLQPSLISKLNQQLSIINTTTIIMYSQCG